MAKKFTLKLDGMEYEVQQQGRAILIDGKRFEPEVLGDEVTLEGHTHKVEIAGTTALVNGIVYPFQTEGLERRRSGGLGVLTSRPVAGDGAVTAIMPGLIIKVLVEPGQKVSTGDPLVVLEAMKMEMPIVAPAGGTVKEIKVAVGQEVEADTVLAIIE